METESKQSFGVVFRSKLSSSNTTIVGAAGQLQIKRTTLLKYLREERYPRTLIPKMCELAGLLGSDGEPMGFNEAYQKYHIKDWVAEHQRAQHSQPAEGDTLKAFFSGIDARGGEMSADDMGKLFRIMEQPNHALVIFTASVMPLIFRCYNVSNIKMPGQVADAIMKYMHLCVIIPKQEVIEKHYRVTYGSDGLLSHQNFQSGYEGFRIFVANRWQSESRSGLDAKNDFDTKVVLLETENCDFHTPGFTHSLFISSPPVGVPYMRALYRLPEDATFGWHVNRRPLEDQFRYERNLASAAAAALRKVQPTYEKCDNTYCTPEGRQRGAINRLIAMLERNPAFVEHENSQCLQCRTCNM